MPRHRQKVADVKGRTVDLLFVGDSLTHNFEEPVGAGVWNEYYEPRNAFNIGFGGDRTEQVLWRIQNGEIDGINPRLTLLLIGTNNTGHRDGPADITAQGIRRILDELLVRLPSTRILLLAIFPCGELPRDPRRRRNHEINAIIQNFADHERIYFRDIGSFLLDECDRVRADLAPDFLHPKEEGYRLWADAIEPDIRQLMT